MSQDLYNQILSQIDDNRAILFLGSGSTRGCKLPDGRPGLDGNELSKEILEELNGGIAPSFDVSLTESSEFFTAIHPSARGGLDRFIQSRLADLQPTLGHYLAASFPWRAVVTTNYNKVVEDSWSVAHAGGYAANEIVSIVTDEDLRKHGGDLTRTRLYKPHGCVTVQMQQESRMVLTSEDYFKSREIRPRMYEDIEALTEDCTTVFVGYSLADYTFRNSYYDLYSRKGKWANRSFSVSPDNDDLRFNWRKTSMDRDFNTTLVNQYFDTFMINLVKARGSLANPLKQRVRDGWKELSKSYPKNIKGIKLGHLESLPEKA